MIAARSTFSGGAQPRNLILRIEPHQMGELFTLETMEPDGRTINASTILYLDGTPRDFQDFECSGIQTSRRVDRETVEILRMCASGEWMRYVRRSVPQAKELVLEITEQRLKGRRVERRLVLTKRLGGNQ